MFSDIQLCIYSKCESCYFVFDIVMYTIITQNLVLCSLKYFSFIMTVKDWLLSSEKMYFKVNF